MAAICKKDELIILGLHTASETTCRCLVMKLQPCGSSSLGNGLIIPYPGTYYILQVTEKVLQVLVKLFAM